MIESSCSHENSTNQTFKFGFDSSLPMGPAHFQLLCDEGKRTICVNFSLEPPRYSDRAVKNSITEICSVGFLEPNLSTAPIINTSSSSTFSGATVIAHDATQPYSNLGYSTGSMVYSHTLRPSTLVISTSPKFDGSRRQSICSTINSHVHCYHGYVGHIHHAFEQDGDRKHRVITSRSDFDYGSCVYDSSMSLTCSIELNLEQSLNFLAHQVMIFAISKLEDH